MAACLSPEVLRAFETAADGDTLEVKAPKEPQVKQNLLSVFDEPLPEEFRGEDLKKPAPAAPAAPAAPEPSVYLGAKYIYRPALVLGGTVSALLLTSAAAFACRHGSNLRACGPQPHVVVPHRARRTRRLALHADADYGNETNACPGLEEALLHQDPSMDPEDAQRVAEALRAAAERPLYEEVREPPAPASPYDAAAPPQKTWAPDEFAEEYSKASRAQVLDVRGEVLRRLATASAAHDPSADLKDALDAVSGPDYRHAYEKGAPGPVETPEGGFLLGLRDHLLRGADGLVHADPAIDLSDLASVKAKARAKLWQRLTDPRFLGEPPSALE
mmetsp:Transcript_15900/g.47425  ORF Transcript_15900/g.47425 Transcript_15900/m.47425 type:complete len:331 (+) Transcript_15900:174-1166(+)|eukprot:CAMPEP_0119261006 /NCGR_PEP_ID=MMETSP1329-20130426/1203_1 /TAXON_ID=114041 /ORGANISM="Genus nov. species nov., Strain RCC1024" /LENGTH=330 /DNA_ID=CAMNT_0007260495 /DNA_START=141 /DNA_END=1133 /DNA_ORIENTATION=-